MEQKSEGQVIRHYCGDFGIIRKVVLDGYIVYFPQSNDETYVHYDDVDCRIPWKQVADWLAEQI